MGYNKAMKINGHDIAEHIYEDLRARVGELQKNNVIPQLVVILVGNNPGSIAYVNQKEISGAKIGAQVTIKRFEETVTTEELAHEIKILNEDPNVHGILIQRPLPPQVDIKKLELLTDPKKDIDGFHPDSPYTLPLPLAIITILRFIYAQGVAGIGDPIERPQGAARLRTSDGENSRQDPVMEWLATQNITILGKGETGGKPIIDYLQKLNLTPKVIDSKTPNTEEILKHADIVISAVGKPDVIKPEQLKQGVVLLGVGMTSGEGKKLHGDYDEKAIENIASFYTPTPRGVGPVNVAMLLDNLTTAAERQT
jgi:methylenetetrahydrofolate dehydrogenase (NADP+) / methenyltetrahydrofolate cyclohydrolase